MHRKLTLISAPAGFGKTTLISEWIAGGERPFAWLSLDERDGDLTRFWTYFIAAGQTVTPTFGTKALGMLESPQPAPAESILTVLLNEIAALPEKFALVLDDYHVLEAPPVDEALAFLLEHLPPQLHLVITTREDPPLPLPRLRARGRLTELRAADLRFTAEETAVFLNKVTGLDFSTIELSALARRTEGWIAGLQLAALSMQGQADVHGFIAAFAGDDRYIVDYLVDEVLQHQPDHIQEFLLQTAILSRLNGSLCDAVTRQNQGGAILEKLERSNLFVVPLDDKRNWYRYHHLFADVLQAHLLKDQPEMAPVLHQRASEWYEQNDLPATAVYHALAAQDNERAARIIEMAWADMDRNRQATEWLTWANKLPNELVRNRPVLCLGYAWAYLDTGEMEAAQQWLREAERCLETPSGFVVADEEEFRYLPGSMAAARTYLALALGDMAGTIHYAQQALDFFPEEAHIRRGTPAALLGLALWAEGNLAEALPAFANAMASYQKAGNLLFVITGAYVLAEMNLAHGRLGEAVRLCEESIQLAEAHGEPVLRGAADLYTALSELSLEQNDLAAAKAYLQRSKEMGEEAALPRWLYRWCVAQARIREAEGDLDGALASLEEAERQYVRGPVPDVRTTAALRARVWLAQGQLAEARLWAVQQALAADDDLTYLREFDHLTLARILIALYRRDQKADSLQQAQSLLERLRQAAEAGSRMGSVIEILIQQALAYEAQGDLAEALGPLERALFLAGPEGYVRIFVGGGTPMVRLLEKMAAAGRGPQAVVTRLLAALGREQAEPPAAPGTQPLVEPLSERELEVLQLVTEGLSNREIAERLYLALPTVKGHNRNIYSKLQVSRRTEAVARARELGLV